MKITIEQLDIIKEIALEAGSAIMEIYNSDFSEETKYDGSPVTEADLRADRVIRAGLNLEFPNIFIWSEESCGELGDGQDIETFFLVDPLDGTKEFIKRNDEFTVNIALVHNRQVIAGVVYLPAKNVIYFAGKEGVGSWKETNGTLQALNIENRIESEPLRIIGSRSHSSPDLDIWLSTLTCEYNFLAAGSSLKFCRVAEGVADIYPRLAPTSQWDTAAAQCILEAAGGIVVDTRGKALEYGILKPVLNPWFFASSKECAAKILRF